MNELKKACFKYSYFLQAALVLIIITFKFRLFKNNINVPLVYDGDAEVFLMYVKSLILNTWNWNIPQLSAPFGFSGAAFPLMTNFDWILMKLLAIFSSEAGFILNIFYFSTILATSLISKYAFVKIGVNRFLAGACGVTYAFLPYVFLRNISHINLVYYAVPILCLISIDIATNAFKEKSKEFKIILYGASVVQGFNYIYFSFFAIFIYFFSSVYGYVSEKTIRPIKAAFIAITIIIASTLLNLTPSFYSWHKLGKPPEMTYKAAAEAEHYGLKIRSMFLPHEENVLPGFAIWAKKDKAAAFPLENENVTVRQGLVGSIGFILSLLLSLRIFKFKFGNTGLSKQLNFLASINLFIFSVVTVGGFGAIFNLLIKEDIRCYNRFSVFISFFSLAILALVVDRLLSSKKHTFLVYTLILSIFIFSVHDQLLGSRMITRQYNANSVNYNTDKVFFKSFAALYPNGGCVIQFPLTGFPLSTRHVNMDSYNHARPYIHSHANMYYSWPSFSNAHRSWQNYIESLIGNDLVEAVTMSGFNIALIDKFGYKDHGADIINYFTDMGANTVLNSKRYIILDLKDCISKQLHGFGDRKTYDHERKKFIQRFKSQPTITYGSGFFNSEINSSGQPFNWSRNRSQIFIRNNSDSFNNVKLNFKAASFYDGELFIEGIPAIKTTSSPIDVEMIFPLKPDEQKIINFHSTSKTIDRKIDIRELVFYIMDLKVSHE